MTNLEKYGSKLDELSRESGTKAWSSGIRTAFILILIFIILTVLVCVFFPFANMLVMLFIFVVEAIALFIPVGIYFHRAGNYMKDRCEDLENTHPGIYIAYEEWKQRELERISD